MCKNCPDDELSLATPGAKVSASQTDKPVSAGGLGLVVYTGGPPVSHLAMLKRLLPPDYRRATFLDDGTIEYKRKPGHWEPPSGVDGYQRDPANPWSFRPRWKSCQWRLFGVQVDPDCGFLQVVAQCSNPIVETFGSRVKCADCDRCDARVPVDPL